mmetsp:Transcript_17286/g.31235  ORF Transcript_17286/g.31235 Transcript_17286/m.31235 type:complete len:112 (-) Transcript_17286:573-908(-)
MERMVEEDTEYQVSVPDVLRPILTPGISREVVCARGETANEAASLRLGFTFQGGLVTEAFHGEDIDGLAIMVFTVFGFKGRGRDGSVSVREEGGRGTCPIVLNVLVVHVRR